MKKARANGLPPKGDAGPVTRFFSPVTRWLFINLLGFPGSLVLCGMLNRVRIYGRSRIPATRNTLLLANHQSMIDSFPIGYAAFFPRNTVRTYLTPWNPAAAENFFGNRFLAWVFYQFKCIPVARGRRDLKALNRSVRALRTGTMVLFPEGTRTRDGSVGRGRPGPGMVILQTRPCVIPVTIDGMNSILPIGARIPRVGKRLSIYFGKPIDYDDLAAQGISRETAQKIVDRAMERVSRQRRVIARVRPVRRG